LFRPELMRDTCAVHDFLVDTPFDAIVFQDWQGIGYASAMAKAAGLSFANSALLVIAHGPTEWLIDANRRVASGVLELSHIQMERGAYSNADAVIAPSGYISDWLRSSGYALSKNIVTMPLYLWAEEELGLRQSQGSDLPSVDAIAFFGRLEERKGIRLFLESLFFPFAKLSPFEVHLVGKAADITSDAILKLVEQHEPSLIGRINFHADLSSDQAQNLIITTRALAIIPSLIDNAPCVVSECLNHNIPFIATRVGGIPELICESDQSRVLVDPSPAALASKLAEILADPNGFKVAAPKYVREEVANRWVEFFRQLEQRRRVNGPQLKSSYEANHVERRRKREGGLTIVITHYERPGLLRQNLFGLALQTCRDFEVIIVDDGSQSDDALSYLALIEQKGYWPFPLQVVRQENRYLGAARNTGIRKAQHADRIIFMDDDNIAFPNMVETFQLACSRLNADIITSQMQIFEEPAGEPDLGLLESGERWAFTGGPLELGLSINCYGDATGMYRRDLFDRVGFFHEQRGVGHEDWHLFVRASLAGLRVISLPVPLFWYRRTAGSMLRSTDMYKNHKLIWNTYRQHLPGDLTRLVDLAIRNPIVRNTER
jgi:O-antigen biosynthesis protein